MILENIDQSKIFYHGTYDKVGEWHKPSVDQPFFITSDYEYAKVYATVPTTLFRISNKRKSDMDEIFVYQVRIKNKLNLFDVRDLNDLKQLFPASILNKRSIFYRDFINSETNNIDILMISCALYAFVTKCALNNISSYKKWINNYYNSSVSQTEFIDITQFIHSLDKTAPTFLAATKNEKLFGSTVDIRQTLFHKIHELNYNGIITSESVHHSFTDEAIGIFDINMLDKISINPV